ncbi:MAG: alpha/beta fold hydrolase [Bryobacteraceae bacterium]
MTPSVLLSAATAAAVAAVAVRQAESAIRVRPERRRVVDDAEAGAMATAMSAEWEPATVESADGLSLRGWFFLPRAWNGRAVLALHGFTDSRRGMLYHVRMLLRAGFAVLAPDSRGHGSSEGELVSFGIHESRDVPLWGDWLLARLGLDRYCALGASMGAAVLLQCLPEEPRIEALVADAPFSRFDDVAYERFAGRAGVTPTIARTLLRPIVSTAWRYIRLRYGIDLRLVRPIEAMRRATKPVLLIHGSGDPAIPTRHSLELHQANPSHSQLWVVEGARHVDAVRVEPGEYERRVISVFGAPA